MSNVVELVILHITVVKMQKIEKQIRKLCWLRMATLARTRMRKSSVMMLDWKT